MLPRAERTSGEGVTAGCGGSVGVLVMVRVVVVMNYDSGVGRDGNDEEGGGDLW